MRTNEIKIKYADGISQENALMAVFAVFHMGQNRVIQDGSYSSLHGLYSRVVNVPVGGSEFSVYIPDAWEMGEFEVNETY